MINSQSSKLFKISVDENVDLDAISLLIDDLNSLTDDVNLLATDVNLSLSSPFLTPAANVTADSIFSESLLSPSQAARTFPANFFEVGSVVRFYGQGFFISGQPSEGLLLELKLGGNTIRNIYVEPGVLPAVVLAQPWRITADFYVRTVGTSGTLSVTLLAEWLNPTSGTWYTRGNYSGGTVTINTTTSNILDLTATWDALTSSPSMTTNGYSVYKTGV